MVRYIDVQLPNKLSTGYPVQYQPHVDVSIIGDLPLVSIGPEAGLLLSIR